MIYYKILCDIQHIWIAVVRDANKKDLKHLINELHLFYSYKDQ